jgi:uncharacterized repeat protein (TIGR01451 family)
VSKQLLTLPGRMAAAVLAAAGMAVGSVVLWGVPQAVAAETSCDGPQRVAEPSAGSPACAPVDLAIAERGPALVRQGEPLEYRIVVANYGPEKSSGWVVKDSSLPKGLVNPRASSPDCSIKGRTLVCHGSPLAKGDSTTFTVTGVAGTGGARFTDSVSVNGKESDPDPSNNVSTASTNIASSTKAVALPRVVQKAKPEAGCARHGDRSTRSSKASKCGSTSRAHCAAPRTRKH